VEIHGFVDADWDGDIDHKDLQVGMCLTYLEEKSLDEKKTGCSGTLNYKS
jgi:hypothetical protein